MAKRKGMSMTRLARLRPGTVVRQPSAEEAEADRQAAMAETEADLKAQAAKRTLDSKAASRRPQTPQEAPEAEGDSDVAETPTDAVAPSVADEAPDSEAKPKRKAPARKKAARKKAE